MDDSTSRYTSYIFPFLTLFTLHFWDYEFFSRMSLLTWAKGRLKKGAVSYNTLIIGGDINAVEFI